MQVETRILLLRHAVTLTPHLFHGAESDVGISDRGRVDSEALGRRLAVECPAATYSSGLLRARETAAPIARACETPHRVREALHERKMGKLSGQPRDEHWQLYEETRQRWSNADLDFTHEGGESFRQVRRRVMPVFEELACTYWGRTIIVVAHGIVIRVALLTLLEDYSYSQFGEIPIDNLRVHDLRRSLAGWRQVPWADDPSPAGSEPPGRRLEW